MQVRSRVVLGLVIAMIAATTIPILAAGAGAEVQSGLPTPTKCQITVINSAAPQVAFSGRDNSKGDVWQGSAPPNPVGQNAGTWASVDNDGHGCLNQAVFKLNSDDQNCNGCTWTVKAAVVKDGRSFKPVVDSSAAGNGTFVMSDNQSFDNRVLKVRFGLCKLHAKTTIDPCKSRPPGSSRNDDN